MVTASGRMSAAATVSTTPTIAATTLAHCRGGSGPRSHGSTQPAATNAYRARPIASTHQPDSRATYTLRTMIRNASTSMSKRAPNAEVVSVRRATRPSTPSSTSATVESATRIAAGAWRPNESTVSAATPQARTARARVTLSAGPSPTWL